MASFEGLFVRLFFMSLSASTTWTRIDPMINSHLLAVRRTGATTKCGAENRLAA